LKVNTTSHVLEYAPPITVGRLPLFRTFLALCAACGIVANLRLITESVGWLRFGSRAYRDLSVNPKAYGRLIEPETIASLRAPYWLWAANGITVLAALVGIFLALYVLSSLIRLRSAPGAAVCQMLRYRRWKLAAALGTLVAATCAGFANYSLEGTATRHISVGTWPPMAWPLILFVGALVPQWWIGKALHDRTAAG
jgi:hypothetical protein